MKRFESTCLTCQNNGRDDAEQRITSNNGGATWRHDVAPAAGQKHHGRAVGVMTQL